jgi:glycosidase
MFSIPGLPVIYYGSEFGMTGASDPDNRRMMKFGNELSEDEKEMLKNVRSISNLRLENSALRYGDFYTLYADENIYAYIRSDVNQRVVVILNKSENQQKVDLSLPEFYDIQMLKDLFSGQTYSVERNNVSVIMDGISYKYLVLE